MPSRKTASDRIPDPRAALGRAAEDAAVRHLERLGDENFALNLRLGAAEIDVIARDGDAIVFVEVRSRSGRGHGGPLETVGAVKQARIARAAAVYLARTGRGEAPARFDVIGVDWCAGEPRLVLVRNAFESPL